MAKDEDGIYIGIGTSDHTILKIYVFVGNISQKQYATTAQAVNEMFSNIERNNILS